MSFVLSKGADELTERFFALSTPRDVASLLEIDYARLVYHLYKVPPHEKYVTFQVPKRSGGSRTISAPATALKIIQQKVNQVLQCVYEPKASVHGFVRRRSILTNASKHVRRSYVLNLDLKDFFPSINFGRVRGMFMAVPYGLHADAATILAQICCFNNELPQGAPSSPIISNMICARMDSQLRRLAQKWRCYYTRYADDMTFSTAMPSFPASLATVDPLGQVHCGRELADTIIANGFSINPNKVRLRTRYRRQEVTGLTVNEKPNVDRRYVRRVRAMLHDWATHGFEAAQNHFLQDCDVKHRDPQRDPPSFGSVVKGRIEFLGMVRGRDDVIYRRLLRELKALAPDLVTAPIDELDVLLEMYRDLAASEDRQRSGYLLEELLNRTLTFFRIQAKPSFKRNQGAEQIDGGFVLGDWRYIVECRWRDPASARDVDGLAKQVSRSGKQTMGLFLSIKGWSDNVPHILQQNREKDVLLMDGADLLCVLEGHIDLGTLVQAKADHLSFHAEPFCPAAQCLTEQGAS